MHQNAFGGRAPPGPAVGAYSAPPDILAGFKGPTSKGEEGREGREGEGKGREGGEEGRKGKGRGEDGTGWRGLAPKLDSWIRPAG